MNPPPPRRGHRLSRLAPLPFWLRFLVLTIGWFCVVLGIAGLFLPLLQGTLLLVIGFALVSLGSESFHGWLRGRMGRWPGLWKKMERLRRRVHARLHRSTSGGARDDEPGPPAPDGS